MRTSKEILAEMGKSGKSDTAYNRLQNEGREGYERDTAPDSLNELAAALDAEFKAEWVPVFAERRAAWNAEMAKLTAKYGTQCPRKEIDNVAKRLGYCLSDLQRAKRLIGVA